MPTFREKTYHNCAVWDVDGIAPFYLTYAVGSASMLRETSGPIPSKIFMDFPTGSPNHWKPLSVLLLGTVQEEIPTECRRIDDVINAEDIVDLLKIDVEGGELHVLRGADKLLSEHRALFIYSEFVLASVRENDSNLWQQHKFLHERGYRLVDLEMNHHRYSREPMKLPKANDRGMVIAGDAVFVLDPDVNTLGQEESQRMAAIAFAFGFSSFAMSLLRDAGLNSEADIAAIEQALQHVRLKKRLKDAWQEVPGKVDNFLRGIYRAIGR